MKTLKSRFAICSLTALLTANATYSICNNSIKDGYYVGSAIDTALVVTRLNLDNIYDKDASNNDWKNLQNAVSCLQAKDKQLRETENFNREWTYMRGDAEGAEMKDFNDSSWEKIGLPHSFSIPYFLSKEFYTGYGWYRKKFNLDSNALKGQIYLEFDGVFQEAEVFLNGHKVGSHVGGYTGFSIDITEFAQKGSNTVAVRVNNIWKPDVAPRAGEHVFSGGIYRNVRIVKTSKVHIAWNGIFVTTEGLEESEGKESVADIAAEIENKSGKDVQCVIATDIVDAEGNIVASTEKTMTIKAESIGNCTQKTGKISNPNLWSPERPYLYKAISKVSVNGILVDSMHTEFGFRWFKWTADKGFFFNGKHLYLRGANVHQDQAGWGDAVTDKGAWRDVALMKEAGFNIIRGSHYPHSPAFSKACDRLGLLFWSEAPFWGIGGFKGDGYWNSSAYPVNKKHEAGFEESALQQLEEMIRIHRNHPSIIAWSMCNEAFFSAPESMDGVRRLLKRMVDLTHKLDPTRPAAIGGAQRPLADDRIDLIGDIAGYNGDGATQPDFQNPPKPNIVSEYGSTTADRPGKYSAGWGDLQKNDRWKGVSWRSGQIIWCGFDHGSIAGSTLGKMGIIDYFRIPKRSWHWYRNEYAGIPHPEWPIEGTPHRLDIKASATRNVKADGTDDVQLTVNVLDKNGKLLNSTPDVTLKIVSGPGEFPTGRSITFSRNSDIRILDGQAAITVRAYNSGKSVIEAISEGLETARIEIEFEGAPKYKEGVSHVTEERRYVRWTNSAGTAENLMTFGVNNPTFASSSKAGKTPGMATDGKKNTFWEADGKDTEPWITVDTEKGLNLEKMIVSLAEQGKYCYTVEVSNDNRTWTRAASENFEAKAGDAHETVFSGNVKNIVSRFVRIKFNNGDKNVSVAEISIKGYVKQ